MKRFFQTRNLVYVFAAMLLLAVLMIVIRIQVDKTEQLESRADIRESSEIIVESRPLLHTFVEIKACGENASQAMNAAFAEMERVNSLLNNYNPESEVSAINKNAGLAPVEISIDTFAALKAAIKFGDISGGAFDVTIGPLLELWGFATDETGKGIKEPDYYLLMEIKSFVDYKALEINSSGNDKFVRRTAWLKKHGMRIDVGAFSKGYTSDMAIKVLKKCGIKSALIAAGGTICAIGTKPDSSPWRVGIKHPRKENSFLTVVSLKDRSVSTSGDYEKFYKKEGKRRTHIIDPRTGMPLEKMQSVTVIAGSGVESDALSTALFVLGPVEGIKLAEGLQDVEALIVSGDGIIYFSGGWPEKKIFY
jgi:FAD:protein FMN transferase